MLSAYLSILNFSILVQTPYWVCAYLWYWVGTNPPKPSWGILQCRHHLLWIAIPSHPWRPRVETFSHIHDLFSCYSRSLLRALFWSRLRRPQKFIPLNFFDSPEIPWFQLFRGPQSLTFRSWLPKACFRNFLGLVQSFSPTKRLGLRIKGNQKKNNCLRKKQRFRKLYLGCRE